MKKHCKMFAVAAILILAASARSAPWETATPEETGFRRDGLAELDNFMRRATGTTGLVIAVKGRIIHTYGDIREVSYIASCRKSVLSMLYGNYVERGMIEQDATLEELGIDDRI